MTTLTSATLDLARSLREAGADEKLTEAITTGVSRAVEAGGSENATKADLANLETQISNLDTRLTQRIYAVAIGVAVGQAGVILAAVFAMIRFML